MTNWKTAKCLRIKGLAIPNEDPVGNEPLKNQQKIFSSGVNSDDISESTDITDLSSHCTSPPRKRQRKDFDDKENNNSNIEISNSLHCQQSSSFNEQKSPQDNDDFSFKFGGWGTKLSKFSRNWIWT